jgi:hypothetical protein
MRLSGILTAFAVTLLPICAAAQSSPTSREIADRFDRSRSHDIDHKNFLRECQSQPAGKSSTAAKTTAASSRLIAVSNMHYFDSLASYVFTDSTTQAYTGTRGSTYKGHWNQWELKADSITQLVVDSGTLQNYSHFSQTFDAHDNILTNTEQRWMSGSWQNSRNTINTYDAMDNILTVTDQYWVASGWRNNLKITNTYTGTNKIATMLEQTWSTTWDDIFQIVYSYDAADNNTKMLVLLWDATSSAWDSSFQLLHTFDASGNLLTETDQIWDTASASWQNYTQVVSTYDAMNRTTSTTWSTWYSTIWMGNVRYLYSDFTGMNPGTLIYQVAASGTFENYHKDSITYNSFNQPIFDFCTGWNDITSAWEDFEGGFITHFYYELLADGIREVSGKGAATVFPVPAKDAVSINVTWTEPQAFTTSIIDMQGRIHRSWQVPACIRHAETVSIADLPAGTYLVRMEGIKDNILQQITVVK